ncbi:MAG: AtpZ/AtpI family protein [Chitinophagaceae bacterium]|nr:MAG: AtpZ/AtpI family protein [Chitinophagaceae bacterium]
MQKQNNGGQDVMRYAGLGAQILVSLGLAVFAGYHADKWVHAPFPIFVWVLPLLVVSLMMYKLIKETSKKK